MEARYEISLNMKTLKGIESYGYFNLSDNREFALEVYRELQGDDVIKAESVISIDLVEKQSGIPFPMALKHCSYAQLAENVKIITKALFKHLNLER